MYRNNRHERILINDLYPPSISNIDDQIPRRLYGKVKRVGDKWVTPDGKIFYKQHLAYKNLHEQLQVPQLEPLKVQDGISLLDFFSLDLDPVIKSTYGLKICYEQPCDQKNESCNVSFLELLNGDWHPPCFNQ